MGDRNPYQAHLCDQNPDEWANGFDFASFWVSHLAHPGEAQRIYHAISQSTGVPFPLTALKVGLPPTPRAEGFMLGVYGTNPPRT